MLQHIVAFSLLATAFATILHDSGQFISKFNSTVEPSSVCSNGTFLLQSSTLVFSPNQTESSGLQANGALNQSMGASAEAPATTTVATNNTETDTTTVVTNNTETDTTTVVTNYTETDTTISQNAYNQTQPQFLNLSNITNIDYTEDMNSTEDCHFMSFEEWKKQKVDAEDDIIVLESSSVLNNSLDIIVNHKKIAEPQAIEHHEDQGKTYKDKFNYASGDCAATVVKTNSDAKGALAILTEVKDSYLLNQCSTPNKFVVIELCQDILINSVVLGNYELFSSMFKTVRFLASDRFPVQGNGWKVLGEVEAENVRDVQTFAIENPLIWARYLKIEIVSHYGDEFYCPISIVRVHGTTMMEEVKEEAPAEEPKERLNSTSQVGEEEEEDECRVVLPYLALNEFLKDFNTSQDFCDVPPSSDSSTATAESTAVKTTQESIFKNIVKRLSLLESNATLSLLYVEEQSKLLSDGFTNLERRQASKSKSLLSKFNQTVFAQVAFLEHALESIKGESNTLLRSQELTLSGLFSEMKEKNAILSSELSFQKKIVIADTVLMLALLVYVIITREFLIAEEPEPEPAKKHKSRRRFPVQLGKRRPKKSHKF